jgi:hypothetical protein
MTLNAPPVSVTVDQHKPEEVEHPVGRGRLPVPSEADRGGKRQGGLGLLHDICLLREIDRDARLPAPGKQTPMRRIRSPCCSRAASGHAAAPPSSVMNWRCFS